MYMSFNITLHFLNEEEIMKIENECNKEYFDSEITRLADKDLKKAHCLTKYNVDEIEIMPMNNKKRKQGSETNH